MIKKLIISAVVLTALISSKEANAAGVGGFARTLSSVPAIRLQVAENRAVERGDGAEGNALTLTFAKRRELLRINSAVNRTVSDLDSYFDGFAGGLSLDGGNACVDCADLKRNHLISLGWLPEAMRIAYAIGAEGRVERVLVIATDSGEFVLGSDSSMIPLSGGQAPRHVRRSASFIAPAFYDI